MTLLERIEADRTAARKGQDINIQHSSFLSYLISEARKVGKDAGNRESTDLEVIGVIRNIIARNEENIRLGQGRDQNGEWQNKLLRDYLPAQMSDEIVEREIKAMMEASLVPRDLKMLGLIMSTLKSQFPGQYNPQIASEIAKRLLQPE